MYITISMCNVIKCVYYINITKTSIPIIVRTGYNRSSGINLLFIHCKMFDKKCKIFFYAILLHLRIKYYTINYYCLPLILNYTRTVINYIIG